MLLDLLGINRKYSPAPYTLLRRQVVFGLLVLTIGLVGCGGASNPGARGGSGQAADAACDEYPAQDIEFVVPYSPGGGFDAWARMLAPLIEENLPNDVSAVVRNVPGSGGITAASQMYVAQPDGTQIGIIDPLTLATAQIGGTADFEAREFTYLARVNSDVQPVLVSGDSSAGTIEDLRDAAPITQATTALTSATGATAIIAYKALGIEFTPVVHEGQTEARLSVIRGDADANITSLESAIEDIRAGDVKPVLLIGEQMEEDEVGYEELKDVQTIADAGYPELATSLEAQRMIFAPPDTPDCIKQVLDQALQDSLSDPDLLAQAEEAERTPAPLNAAEATAAANEAFDTLSEYEDVVKETIEANAG